MTFYQENDLKILTAIEKENPGHGMPLTFGSLSSCFCWVLLMQASRRNNLYLPSMT
jgi:hypothetical protein